MIKKTLQTILKTASSWQQIYDQLIIRNTAGKVSAGKLFEYFCKYYYLCEPTVAANYEDVWLYEETPQEVKKKLNIAKQDHGIDLVLKDQNGAFTIVQCKFRNDQNSRLSWTKDKIANLFAEADKTDYITVFTNASDLDHYSKGKQAKKFQLTTLGELLEISPETIRQMARLIINHPILRKQILVPRDHQKYAIKRVVSGFQVHDRGQLILPCGAGKTLTAFWIKEKLDAKHSLVLVPSLALLRQIKNEWQSAQKKWVPYLCVCSEHDIDNSTDTPVMHTYEIGGRVTTDVNEIRNFLRQHDKTIIYSTYQSIDAVSAAVKGLDDFSFDLAICDEAHKTSGSKISTFGHIHNNVKIPVKKRLYMTATPRIVSEQARVRLDDDQIKYLADMNDKIVFGPEFYRMSFATAIDKGILVDYRIIAIGVSDTELQQQIIERQFVDDDGITIEDIANNYALEKVMVKYGVTHAITFHSSIKRAEQFKNRHKKLYPALLTDHVSGIQTTNDRNVALNRFRNSPKAVITNARCMTEGVDVPAIDVVYFCDPKNSKVDIVQASGRALRKTLHKKKKFGYIVVPIYHREVENIEDTIEGSAFNNLITVVRALCGHDERLVEEINRIKLGKGVRKPTPRSTHIHIEDELDLIILENFENKLCEAIFDQVIEKIGDNWLVMYEKLKKFRESNPLKWPTAESKNLDENKLGFWCQNRRRDFKKGILSAKHIELLNDIGFPWDPFDELWQQNFQQVTAFRNKYPNKWPSSTAQDQEEKMMGSWCGWMRRKNKTSTLLPEYKKLLDSIGFPWDPFDELWQQNFQQVTAFRNKYPNKWPSSTVKDQKEKKLGNWCLILRRNFKKNVLSSHYIKQLDDIGFPWDPFDEIWQQHFKQIIEFHNKYSNKWPSSTSSDSHEKMLGTWCGWMRRKNKTSTLLPEYKKLLDSIGFPWIKK